jgi:hypothetical protein
MYILYKPADGHPCRIWMQRRIRLFRYR